MLSAIWCNSVGLNSCAYAGSCLRAQLGVTTSWWLRRSSNTGTSLPPSSLLQMQSAFFMVVKLKVLLKTRCWMASPLFPLFARLISTSATCCSQLELEDRSYHSVSNAKLYYSLQLFSRCIKNITWRFLSCFWMIRYFSLANSVCVLFWTEISHVPLPELLIKGIYGQMYPTIIKSITDSRQMAFAHELESLEILSVTPISTQ